VRIDASRILVPLYSESMGVETTTFPRGKITSTATATTRSRRKGKEKEYHVGIEFSDESMSNILSCVPFLSK